MHLESPRRHRGDASLVRHAPVESLERRLLLAGSIRPTRPADGGHGAPAPVTLGQWHTYAGENGHPNATADLQSFASTYPSLARLISIGTTFQGRQIWAMEISDNVGVEEDEPEFYYNGAIHGDEPIGMENSFYMINELLTNYNGAGAYAQRLTNLVNNMDIWFVPELNWDGYMRNGSGSGNSWRYNANGIDLNRNFPEWTNRSFSSDTRYFGNYGNMFDGPAPQTGLLQPETVAAMNFMRTHNFVAGANFHSGDLVVNYPWDTDGSVGANYAVAPDDALFRETSLIYSTQNTPMYNNNTSPFVHGTTDGDLWYPISGGLQDWANLYTGQLHFTIELNTTKFPAQSTLPTMWTNNRESMLQYMETANWGIRGIITDANTGAPVFAKMTVISPASSPTPDPNHPTTRVAYSDPDLGDYHRELLPGTYTLKFEAPGYQTQTISGVVISSRTNDPTATARLNVQLPPIDTVAPTVSSGQFTFNGSPQTLAFTFSEQVQGVDNTDLILTDNTANTTVPSGNIVLDSYNSTTHVATFRFNYAGGTLPGASYTASFNTAGITDLSNNPLAGGYAYNFLYAAGDSNNDSIYAVRSGSLLKVWKNANPQTDPATYQATFATLSNFSCDGFGGDDVCHFDFSGGEVRPTGANGFGWRMGSNNETLQLSGPVTWNFTIDPTATDTPNLALVLDTGAAANFSAAVTHLNGLALDSGALATLAAGSSRLLVTSGLSIAGNATLELNDNDLIDFYPGASQLAAVVAAISSARAGGAWTGTGITSSFAKNDPPRRTTLGAIEADDFRSVYGTNARFDGETMTGRSAVLVKYTWYGDVDFNGRVDGADYAHLDATFNQETSSQSDISGWFNGDLDYNGKVDGADYALIDGVFNSQDSIL